MPIEQHPFTSNRWINNLDNPIIGDKWFVNRNTNNEILSFGFMPNSKVKSIFLGSFPIWEITDGPIGDQNVEFFYGSFVNDFWPCIGSISEMPINNLPNRITILNSLNFGITDILETVDRNPANCSLDNCLTAVNYNNILNLKESFPLLKNIYITSGGKGPVGNLNNNNKNVATWFKDSVINQNILGFNANGFVKSISINNNEFNLIYLFSPSNSANPAIKGEMNRNNNFGINELSIKQFRKLQWGYFIKEFNFNEINNETIDGIHNLVTNNPLLLEYFIN
jgi:G:T/U-mismatch repair DNA glycosylase